MSVIPLTSKKDSVIPFQLLLLASQTGLPKDSKAQAEQIRSVNITRVGAKLGLVPHDVMKLIEDAIRLQLALD